MLYAFTGGSDGGSPLGGLIRDAAGNLYGTTYSGGAFNVGVVFKLDPAGDETVLYTFTSGADGANPQYGDLVQDAKGDLYGTTGYGGNTGGSCPAAGCGVVFRLDPAGNETVLYSFTGGADGANPFAGLPPYKGYLYGTTAYGGNAGGSCRIGSSSGCGVVFKLR